MDIERRSFIGRAAGLLGALAIAPKAVFARPERYSEKYLGGKLGIPIEVEKLQVVYHWSSIANGYGGARSQRHWNACKLVEELDGDSMIVAVPIPRDTPYKLQVIYPLHDEKYCLYTHWLQGPGAGWSLPLKSLTLTPPAVEDHIAFVDANDWGSGRRPIKDLLPMSRGLLVEIPRNLFLKPDLV